MLSGAGVIDDKGGENPIHLVLEGRVCKDGMNIKVNKEDFDGYSIVVSGNDKYEDLKTYVMVLADDEINIVDYLGSEEIASTEIAAKEDADNGIKNGDLVIKINNEVNQAESAKKSSAELYAGNLCRVDCYATTTKAVTTLTVDAENFGGTYYIEAETLFRDEATGSDFPATFIIPKGKIQGNFTFNMAATGDPSTFDFTIDCTLGSVRGRSGKVLYAIDIIDTTSTDSHIEHATKDVPEQKPTWTKKTE